MYVKMFTQIFDSSIADDYQVRHVFEDICKLADVDGVVDMTPEAIASRTRVPLKIVNTSLAKLAAPDPRSRSPVVPPAAVDLLGELARTASLAFWS